MLASALICALPSAPAFAACTVSTPCTTGALDLGNFDPRLSSQAYGVSAYGSVVVGYGNIGFAQHAFRWTQATGMVDIHGGDFVGSNYSNAAGVSADGSVVVGSAQDVSRDQHAFRWTQGTGMVDIHGGDFQSDFTSAAYAVNADGSVVVGAGYTASAVHAFRWTQATGMVDIHGGDFTGGNYSNATGVSADGSVVVGQGYTGSAFHAFRWTQGTGMVDIHGGDFIGGNYSVANGVSANGAVVVGNGYTNTYGHRAFRWTQATGMRDLNTLLASAGVNMTGINLFQANAVSANGQFIVGTGDFSGNQHAYLVRYDDGAGAGLTTQAAQQDSVDALANQRSGVMAQQHGLAAPLLGSNQPMGGGSEAGIYASAGSASVGGTARYSNGRGLSFLGGLAWAREDYANADLKNSYIAAAAAQYVYDGFGWLRPFIEGGGWISPDASLSFTRDYMNGAGTATGKGDTKGTLSYYYARAGVLLMANEKSQLALSGEYGREQLHMSAYAEDTTANPFNASASAGTDRMDVAKARVSASHQFTPQFDATLWAAQAWGFNRASDVTSTVIGFGTLTPTALQDVQWTEFGARLGYKVSERVTLDMFGNGVSGGSYVGTRFHGGAGLRVRF